MSKKNAQTIFASRIIFATILATFLAIFAASLLPYLFTGEIADTASINYQGNSVSWVAGGRFAGFLLLFWVLNYSVLTIAERVRGR